MISIDPAKPAGDQLPVLVVDEILRLVAGSGPGGLTPAQLALIDQVRPLLDGLGGKPGALAADVVTAWNALVAQVANIPTGANLVNAVTVIVDNLPITANLQALIDGLAGKPNASVSSAVNKINAALEVLGGLSAAVGNALAILAGEAQPNPGEPSVDPAVLAWLTKIEANVAAWSAGGGGAVVQGILDAFGGGPGSTVDSVELYVSGVDGALSTVSQQAYTAYTGLTEWLVGVNGGPSSAPGGLVAEALAKWSALVARVTELIDRLANRPNATPEQAVATVDNIGREAEQNSNTIDAWAFALVPAPVGDQVAESAQVLRDLVALLAPGGAPSPAQLKILLAALTDLTGTTPAPDPVVAAAVAPLKALERRISDLESAVGDLKTYVDTGFQEIYDAVTGPNASLADVQDRFEKLGKWLEQLFDNAGIAPNPPPRAVSRAADTPLPLTHIPGVVKGISMNRLKALVADGVVPHTLDGRTKLVKPSDVVAALKDADG